LWSVLGALKHCLNIEAGYFGPTFGREFPTPEELVPTQAFDADPQADWYATEDETKDGLIDLYRRVAVFTDQTIEQLPLDAPGRVPWWRPGAQDVTLQRIIVHVIYDLARHAGHADNGGGNVVGEVPDPEAEWWTMSASPLTCTCKSRPWRTTASGVRCLRVTRL
jgi:uncharacterized protein DUF664